MTAINYSLPLKHNAIWPRFNTSNVGGADRLLRIILGGVLIADGLYGAGSMSLLGAVLIFLSVPLIISAIVAWDPIYAMFKVRTATLRVNDTLFARNRKHNANGGINVGTVDRMTRITLAGVLLATPFILAGSVGYAAVIGTMLGIVVMMTAITGWDPIYQLTKIRTAMLPIETAPLISIHSPTDKLALIDDVEGDDEDIYQKAA